MRSNNTLKYRDIWFNKIPLNDVTTDLTCLVTSVDGWWGPPESDIPEDEKTYTEDGNYVVPGRYTSRLVEIEGVVIPNSNEDATSVIAWRDALVTALGKCVRDTGTLTFYEDSGTKILTVQVNDKPILDFASQTNTLTYNIEFYAADPNKYNSKLSKKSVAISEKPTDFVTPTPDPEVDITLTTTGRTYHELVVSETETYATFPRTYNRTALFWDSADQRYSSQITVINDGDTTTYGTIVMNGPVTNPAVKHVEQGKYLLFNLELVAGETITIDLQEKTAKLNDESTTSVLAKMDFSSRWFNFDPGQNTLTFYGDDIQTEQIGWAAATNYVKNPSVELTTGDTTYIAFQDLFNHTVSPTSKTITSQIPAINSSDADGTTPSFIKSAVGATAQLSSWFGSVYDESDKSVAITSTTSSDGDSYVVLDTNLEPGNSYVITANLYNDGSGTHQVYSSSLYIKYNSTVLYKQISSNGIAQLYVDIPENATNIEVRIYNGYNKQTALNPETEAYEDIPNVVYAKDITITESIIPGTATYQASPYFKPTEAASALYIDEQTTKIYGYGYELVTMKNITIPDEDYFTFLAYVTSDVKSLFTVVCHDPDEVELDYSYPSVTLEAGVKTLVVIRMEKPDFDFELCLNIGINSAYTMIIENPNLVNNKMYGSVFNKNLVGLSDANAIASGTSYALTRKRPQGFESAIVAVDDLETYSGYTENNVYKSASVSYEGTFSVALTPLQESITGFVEAVKVTCVDWSTVPNGTVTVYASVKASGDYFKDYLHVRSIGVLSNGVASYSESAPLDGDMHTLVHTFTKTNNDVSLYLLGGGIGASETYFDGILVTSGVYTDRYFQGGMDQATWSSTEHNSTSNQTYKETIPGSVTEIYYRDAWIT